jgi:hypothetical protein
MPRDGGDGRVDGSMRANKSFAQCIPLLNTFGNFSCFNINCTYFFGRRSLHPRRFSPFAPWDNNDFIRSWFVTEACGSFRGSRSRGKLFGEISCPALITRVGFHYPIRGNGGRFPIRGGPCMPGRCIDDPAKNFPIGAEMESD